MTGNLSLSVIFVILNVKLLPMKEFMNSPTRPTKGILKNGCSVLFILFSAAILLLGVIASISQRSAMPFIILVTVWSVLGIVVKVLPAAIDNVTRPSKDSTAMRWAALLALASIACFVFGSIQAQGGGMYIVAAFLVPFGLLSAATLLLAIMIASISQYRTRRARHVNITTESNT